MSIKTWTEWAVARADAHYDEARRFADLKCRALAEEKIALAREVQDILRQFCTMVLEPLEKDGYDQQEP